MRSSRAALLALALAPHAAWAGACCVGSTGAVPTRLGECEHQLAGLSLGGEEALGRWDRGGALAPDSLRERSLVGSFGAAARFDRRLQLGVTLPVRWMHRATSTLDDTGGGPGDLRAVLVWDPLEERFEGPLVPVFTLGLRLPTGRDWRTSRSSLQSDVTGLPGPAAVLGLQLERTLGDTPASVSVEAETGLSEGGLWPIVTASASLGRYLGPAWTALGTASYTTSWAAIDGTASATARPRLGARLVHGRRLAWRAWLGADLDLPVPGLGRAATQYAAVSLGAAAVR